MLKTVAEKQQTNFKQLLAPILWGIVSAFIVSILLLAAFSVLMAAKDMPSGFIMPFACVSISAGAFFGGLVASRFYRSRGLFLGVITGLLFYIVLYIVGAIMRQADLNAMLLLKIILSVVLGAVGGIAGVNIKRRKSKL